MLVCYVVGMRMGLGLIEIEDDWMRRQKSGVRMFCSCVPSRREGEDGGRERRRRQDGSEEMHLLRTNIGDATENVSRYQVHLVCAEREMKNQKITGKNEKHLNALLLTRQTRLDHPQNEFPSNTTIFF